MKTQHTPECRKANGSQTQFDLTCKRCNRDSYESVTALRPEAEKFYAPKERNKRRTGNGVFF